VSDRDRKLVDLIDDVTGGVVQDVRYLVDVYGSAAVARVIGDGFGVVFLVSGSDPEYHEAVQRALNECRVLTTEDAVALVRTPLIPPDYRIHQAPGAFDLEDEPNLLFRYAADDPEAVAEVRRQHAERRGPAERQRREFWELRRKAH
jgi:hypothetical protein